MRESIRDGYRAQKKFATKYSSAAIILVLLVYYAIVYFHIGFPPHDLFLTTPFNGVLLPFYALSCVFSLIGVGIKGSYLFYTRSPADTAKGLLNRFLILNAIFLIFDIALVSIVILSRLMHNYVTKQYVNESHLFWISILTFCLFCVFYYRMKGMGLIRWETLKDLHAVPVVSPAFAFGAPFVFSQSLKVNNIPDVLKVTHQSLFFISGVIFIVYLVVFYMTKSMFETPETTSSLIGMETRPKRNEAVLATLFALFAAGMYFLICPVLDIVFYNQFS